MAYDKGVNGMFYSSLATLLCSSLTDLIIFCYKSKCSEFKYLCIKVKVNVDIKKQEDLQLETEKFRTNFKNNI